MRVRWTELAAQDLANIFDYIHKQSSAEAAGKMAPRIHDAIGALVQFPHRGRRGRKPGTRELILSGLPYLTIYRVKEDVIEINRILHGAQKWP